MKVDGDGKFDLTVKIRDFEKENVTLRADVARLTEAIEWTIEGIQFELPFFTDQLRARTFPPTEPEYNEVEVTAYKCSKCGTFSSGKRPNGCCIGWSLIELKGIDRIPRKKKEKKSAKCFRNIVTGAVCFALEGASPDWVDAVLTWEE